MDGKYDNRNMEILKINSLLSDLEIKDEKSNEMVL